ncbi:hypothetical protein MMC10_001974 [Thelotrema lepadinum]|nr:hypothetical protein [Thelotrema lepadinum]
MSQGLSPSIALEDEQNPQHIQRLERSPHPYSRRSSNNPERLHLNRQGRPNPLQLFEDRFPRAAARNAPQRSESGIFRSKDSITSPSDSGTEADDERPLLKALTAPPLRPRKGLKGTKDLGTDPFASPLLTPSSKEEEEGRSGLLAGHAVQERKKGKLADEAAGSKDKVRQKRYGRVEFVRRVLETILIGAIGYTCLNNRDASAFRALRWHVLLLAIIYSTYILRLALRSFINKGDRRSWTNIYFPTNADPAPLLYPIFLPLLVTWSMRPANSHALLSNYILSFSALPRSLIPRKDFYIHWMVSLIPLLHDAIMRRYELPLTLISDNDLSIKTGTEELILLFPLHCMLLQTLAFLTTTSLLPAELQLLSISLINLLRFGTSSQSLILKGLLWIGGVALVASCRHILQWSVELARIPSWRFRRRKYPRINRPTLICAIDDTFGGWVSQIFRSRKRDESSDEEWTPSFPRNGQLEAPKQPIKSAGVTSFGGSNKPNGSRVSLDDLSYRQKQPTPRIIEVNVPRAMSSKRRRHTLPSSLAPITDIPTITRKATDALASARVRSRLLLRLTAAQATVLKWLYAAFVYLVVVAIILVPVRLFIGHSALNENEPVGWALGYLFGNLDAFRLRVVVMNLEHWICLPERYVMLEDWPGLGEQLRLAVFGPANSRLLICGWCAANIAIGLAIVSRLSSAVEVDTRRKVFHGMMVSMFLPTIFIDPTFIALAFALILAIFLLLDLFRASQLPPLSKPLTYFLAPYVDGRDHRGPIIISHIFLLIGCAIPLWLSLADIKRTGYGAFAGWDVETRDLSMVTGVICVGMGDAAASLIGRRYGHRRWPWSGGKSLEGSAAFALAVVIGLMSAQVWLSIGEWKGASGDEWLTTLTKSTIAGCGASLTEAVLTGGNDNVIVPVVLWLLVKGLGV